LLNQRYYERKARKKKEAEEAAKKAATTSSSSFAANSATNSAAAAASSKPKFNNGWDDENFDMLVTQNDPIGEHYRMLNVLGKGSFGQVVRAEDRRTNEMVAIKVIKSKRPFFEQARTEISVLSFLNQRDPHDQHNIGTCFILNEFVLYLTYVHCCIVVCSANDGTLCVSQSSVHCIRAVVLQSLRSAERHALSRRLAQFDPQVCQAAVGDAGHAAASWWKFVGRQKQSWCDSLRSQAGKHFVA
jgi:hypothetical protein